MGITGFCILRMLGHSVTPEHFSSECMAVHSPKCCWEDMIGSWLHYFVNESKNKILLRPPPADLLVAVAPTRTLAEAQPQRTKAMVPTQKGSFKLFLSAILYRPSRQTRNMALLKTAHWERLQRKPQPREGTLPLPGSGQ